MLQNMALKTLVLNDCGKLTGALPPCARGCFVGVKPCCPGATPGFGTFFVVLMGRPFPPHLPASPGDIAALQNMPLEQLDLTYCGQLTGKPTVHVGRISKNVSPEPRLDRSQERSSK